MSFWQANGLYYDSSDVIWNHRIIYKIGHRCISKFHLKAILYDRLGRDVLRAQQFVFEIFAFFCRLRSIYLTTTRFKAAMSYIPVTRLLLLACLLATTFNVFKWGWRKREREMLLTCARETSWLQEVKSPAPPLKNVSQNSSFSNVTISNINFDSLLSFIF